MIRFPQQTESHEVAPVYALIDDQLRRYADRIDGAHLSVEIVVEHEAEQLVYSPRIIAPLSMVLAQAFEVAPAKSTIEISVAATIRGFEIEVAVESDVPAGARADTQVCAFGGAQQAAFVSGIPVYYSRCPQGGTAVTIVVADRQIRKTAA